MYVFLAAVIFIVVMALVKSIPVSDKKKEEKNNKTSDMKKDEIKVTNEGVQIELGARDLVMHVLTQIGCQYTIDDDNDICFRYQGETFYIRASNEYSCITIWDFCWGQCELHDVELFSRIKHAINKANGNTNITTFYTINEAGGTVEVHCKKSILFMPQIPDIEGYFRAMLDEIFDTHRFISLEIERQKNNNA